MDADALSLLVILKGELKHIANDLQYETREVIDDIMTDNGIVNDEENDELSPSPSSHDEDEKAQELHLNTKQKLNYNQIGIKLEELIENYLTPSIKQIQRKKSKKNRKKSDINDNSNYSNSSQLLFDASPHHNHHHNNNNNNTPSNQLLSSSSLYCEPGQVIDSMSNYTEKLGSCCRKFITSLFCGCGMFQTIGIFMILLIFGTAFVFYRANEFTLILKEINRWKELSVKHIEYELDSKKKLAQINFDLDVDIDKLKQEHQHRETMEIIQAKKLLTKEFIDKNTRTVTTTYWNFLTTETETVSQTIFSEDDIAFFQNNILYYGFNSDKAIESSQQNKQNKQNKDKETQLIDDNTNDHENDDNDTDIKPNCFDMDDVEDAATCKSSSSSPDSFDSI